MEIPKIPNPFSHYDNQFPLKKYDDEQPDEEISEDPPVDYDLDIEIQERPLTPNQLKTTQCMGSYSCTCSCERTCGGGC